MKIVILNNQARAMYLFWRILISSFKSLGHEIICLVPAGDEESDRMLAETGAKIRHYPLDRKGLNPLKDLRTFLSFKNFFLKEKPDLLFASTIKPVIYGCLAAKAARVPSIFAAITGLGYVFESDSALKKIINLLGVNLYKFALANINGVFFQNSDDRQLFEKLGIIGNTPVYMTAGTGVDLKKFRPAPFPSDRNIRFLLIARLLEAKGLHEYAGAATMLKEKWPDAAFQLLGPQEYGPGAISSNDLEKWQKAGAIEYLGQTSDVRPYIANSHVAVLPSWREGVPTSVMEAMAMGRPAVVANSPGCRELVKEGENGFLSVPRDAESLAAAMEKFLLQPELIAEMGNKSLAIIEAGFDAQKVAKYMLETMLPANRLQK